ncbi:MAG: alkaline phosphatase PhoX [Sporichthyaceae bacterium]
MTELDRRTFLKTSAAVAAGNAVAGGPFIGLTASSAQASGHHDDHRRHHHAPGYGPLSPQPDLLDGITRLSLPAGFSYRSFALTGSTTDDGAVLPKKPDGMGAFHGRDGRTVLLRNHEIGNSAALLGAPGSASDHDAATGGGVVGLEVTAHGHLERSWVAMNGTLSNCAAGSTPWGTLLSNEESVNGPDVGNDFTGSDNAKLTAKHGYLYEVPSDGGAPNGPITHAGRFAHEGSVIDPRDGTVYMTEDDFAFPSGFYHYRSPVDPRRSGRIRDGGRLQMLKVVGQPNRDFTGHVENGSRFATMWVDIDDPDPTFAPGTTNNEAIRAVADQGLEQGACFFSRLEGAVWSHGAVWFTSTQGGMFHGVSKGGLGQGEGQVWAYEPRSGMLTMVYESPGPDVLDMPDNIGVSKHGAFILCEDGNDTTQYLRGLTASGTIFDFAMNITRRDAKEEFAGAVWSQNGHTLFVNLQMSNDPARTFAIWGLWQRGAF